MSGVYGRFFNLYCGSVACEPIIRELHLATEIHSNEARPLHSMFIIMGIYAQLNIDQLENLLRNFPFEMRVCMGVPFRTFNLQTYLFFSSSLLCHSQHPPISKYREKKKKIFVLQYFHVVVFFNILAYWFSHKHKHSVGEFQGLSVDGMNNDITFRVMCGNFVVECGDFAVEFLFSSARHSLALNFRCVIFRYFNVPILLREKWFKRKLIFY